MKFVCWNVAKHECVVARPTMQSYINTKQIESSTVFAKVSQLNNIVTSTNFNLSGCRTLTTLILSDKAIIITPPIGP